MSTSHLEKEKIEVIKRDGSKATFDPNKIRLAIEKAFCAEYGVEMEKHLPEGLQDKLHFVARESIAEAIKRFNETGVLDIESIQDIVERQLMAADQHAVARRYILYREEHNRMRMLYAEDAEDSKTALRVIYRDGRRHPLDLKKLRRKLSIANEGLEDCSSDGVLEEAVRNLYDGATIAEVHKALILSARTKIEREPAYNYFTARLLLQEIYAEVFGVDLLDENEKSFKAALEDMYRKHFAEYIQQGVDAGRIAPELLNFNLKTLANRLVPSRDELFQFIGLHILYDRYFLQIEGRRIETPQYFWMRVAMGVALNEKNKEEKAAEFYDILSQFYFVSSTPTLFNSGTRHPQLSSCFISTTYDDLDHIFKVIGDNARLSKWAGGIGNDWTNVRAQGALIKGTNGRTQGIVPFLKVANDTAVAVNQGGKRKGVTCAYLETWHLDIEDFLELRKNSGDDRRRTHDMNTANWIPDLFMKRVKDNADWTLFNPCDVKDLHELYGQAFEKRYIEYEKMAQYGHLAQFKKIPARDLWRKMITMLFETGHPWITFKDPCNIRSPQKHVGVIHSSNLCTEITLNNSETETAVCNLGSLNLVAFLKKENGQYILDENLCSKTIRTAMRMLDNVIDLNYYPTPETRTANLRHRPVGLGMMGFQDALYLKRIPYDSQEAVEFADRVAEFISYHAIHASMNLAKERGAYESFEGSLWSQGHLPLDTVEWVEKEREMEVGMDRSARLDWEPLRREVQAHGMRNSNTMAIAPTATIGHIAGVSPSIEPAYSHLYSRSNLSGEFTALNPYLVEELKKLSLWDEDMLDELKYFDGSIQAIERIPQHVKNLFKTAFEVDPKSLVNCASRRQKWIDMSQSLNLFVRAPSGALLSDLYFHAWSMGLKTTYYLRTLAATQVEKSTIDVNRRGIQPRWMKSRSASSGIQVERVNGNACDLSDPSCESCQ